MNGKFSQDGSETVVLAAGTNATLLANVEGERRISIHDIRLSSSADNTLQHTVTFYDGDPDGGGAVEELDNIFIDAGENYYDGGIKREEIEDSLYVSGNDGDAELAVTVGWEVKSL